MATFSKLQLTARGIEAQLNAQGGGAPITFTKIGIGSGEFSGNASSLTSLVKEEVFADIEKAYVEDNLFTVMGTFTNENLTVGFTWREIGLYFDDGNGNDVLYCYGNAGDAYDHIPTTTDVRYTKTVRIATAFSNAENVKIIQKTGKKVDEESFWAAKAARYRNKYHKPFSAYKLPSTFDTDMFPISIFTDGYTAVYDFDITNLKNTGGATWYVSTDGTGDGSSADAPTTIDYLFFSSTERVSDGDTVILLDGIYDAFTANAYMDDYDTFRGKLQKNINMIAQNPGKVTIASVSAVDAEFTSSGSGVYTATRSQVLKVVQILDKDDLVTAELKRVDSAESVTEGTWYLDDSNTLYVYLFGGAVPVDKENVLLLLNYSVPVLNFKEAGRDVNFYAEGINFIGGTPSNACIQGSAGYTMNFIAKDCAFLHAYDSALARDAVSVRGANAYFENCRAEFSSKDGFNYHSYDEIVPNFIELGCVGANNGIDGFAESSDAPWQNGSTAHDGAKGIRIGGTYYNNYGGNVADVHEGTETVNIDCTAFDSAYTGDSETENADFIAQQAGTTMHLLNCRAFGSKTSAYAVTDALIKVQNCDLQHEAGGNAVIG